MRCLTKELFNLAARKLRDMQLGTIIEQKDSNIFIKKRPDEIQEILSQNSDLASIEEYVKRFSLPPRQSVPFRMMQRLILQGLVSPDLFQYQT